MFFGVPQRSIIDPALFNFYAAELADRTYSTTIQYADNTTISKLHECAIAIQKDAEKLLSWSHQNNLMFNSDKLQSAWCKSGTRTTRPGNREPLKV